ncbi:MAG: exosortase [Proteobacteria bacterium]|nr:exosortase [Pseudomonadota bacterium]
MADDPQPAPTLAEEFLVQFRACWARLPDKPLFFTLLGAWVVLFHFLGHCSFNFTDQPSLFAWMWGAWSAPALEAEHGKLVPGVVLFLLWLRRDELLAAPTRRWLPALAGVALALAVQIVAFTVQQPRVSMVALVAGVWSFTGLVWGPVWLRKTFFPFLLLGFCVPLESFGEGFLFQLRLLVTKISVGLGHDLLGMDVVRDGTRIFNSTRTFNYDVAPACSGIRSLTSLLAVTTIYGCVAFRAPWRRAVMVGLAVPLAVTGNVARITTVIVLAEAFGHQTGAAAETNLGYVTFAVAIGLMFAAGWLLREKTNLVGRDSVPSTSPVGRVSVEPSNEHSEASAASISGEITSSPDARSARADAVSKWGSTESHPAGEPSRPATPLFGTPLIAALLLMVLAGGVIHHLQARQKLGRPGVLAEPVAGSARWRIILPERVGDLSSRVEPAAEVELTALPADTSIGKRIYRAADGAELLLQVVLMGRDRTSIHQPQYCLTGQGWLIEQTEEVRLPLAGPPGREVPALKLTATKLVTLDNGQRVPLHAIYVYWFVTDGALTAHRSERLAAMATELLRTGTLQRWAYVAAFAQCLPGEEETTYGRIKAFLAEAVPQFQK